MSKEGTTENKGSKGKLIAALIILILVIGGGIYYYLNAQQKNVNAVFEQLQEQGIVFKEWKKNSDETYSLVEPKLQVSENTQLNVESINVAIKDDNLLDITLKDVAYKNDIVEVALPTITISGYKLNKDIFDERLKDKMSSFALHLLSNDFKSMVFDNLVAKLSFEMEGIYFSTQYKLQKYEFLDYKNGILSEQNINKYENNISMGPDDVRQIVQQTVSIESLQAKDNNLRLQTLMVYIADDKPDQPFQKIIGPAYAKNYKVVAKSVQGVLQSTVIEEMTSDGFSLRFGKKAPIDTISNSIVFAKSIIDNKLQGKEAEIDYPKLFGLVRDMLYMVEMVGPFKQAGKNISSVQNESAMNIDVKMDAISIAYEPFETSIEYKGVDISVISPLLDNKVLVAGKIGVFGIQDVNFSSLYNLAISELDKLSKLKTLPNERTYFLGFMTNIGKIYPQIGRIELKNFDFNMPLENNEIKFDEISLTNKYAVAGPIPTSVDFNIANYQQTIEELKYFQENFGLTDGRLKFSMRVQADWNEKDKQISLHDSFLETNLTGRADFNATIGQVQPYLFSGNLVELTAAATGLTLKDFKISIDDKGNLKIFKEGIAKEENISSEEVGYGLIASVISNLQDLIEDDDIRATIIAPIAKFINNGGVLVFDAKSKTNFGVAFPSFAMTKSKDGLGPLFDLFNITVSVE